MKKRTSSPATLAEAPLAPELPVSDMRPLGSDEPDFPLADAFFSEAIARRSLSHGYILKGSSYGAMYRLVLQLARIVNCRKAASLSADALDENGNRKQLAHFACGECTDCRWVEQNTHPAVLTLSRLTYLVSESGSDLGPDDLEKLAKKGNAATQIKAEQIDRLLKQLSLSTNYTRVVIFTDAEEWPAERVSDVVAPFEWRNVAANQDKSFHIRPLERRLFNHASANRFLKTLEEPPPRTLFFFIADTEEQILETIVSRCQAVPCQMQRANDARRLSVSDEDRTFLRDFLPRLSSGDAFQTLERFESFFVQERGLTPPQALDALQLYVRERYLQNGTLTSETAFQEYRELLRRIDTARQQIEARVNESQALLNLFLR